ncbi:disease resistance protein RGA2-like [Eucalyptus grandis]|uniref:disease resistance protein RGA2-like n=1 Tax=Eucalyptus grandis TaxID=71139 RepID=UPI00192EA591|nr:disease resistance protein RGA2-like [Eucalyptus grandis]
MPIAELFLCAFLQVLFDRLTSVELLNFARREGIDTRLKDWEQMLKSIQKVLDDAEDKQLTDQAWVKLWLEDLRNLAYDIEDLLDEFVIESVESKSKTGPSTSKAHSLLPSCCFKLIPREFTFNHEMRSKIEEMDATLREITKRKDNLSPIENNGKQSTNHLPGMPGLGKTALAQQVFNDAGVTSYFDAKAWKVLCDLLSEFKYLRVLSLNYYVINEVPDCIGKLRHLRHLNLSHTHIRLLPKSIVALHNLEALMLQGCEYLIELPEGNLVGLEMLSKFIVGIGNGSRLKELKNLENLRGELCISDLHKVQEVEDANDANLRVKKGICRLTMQWSIDFEISRNIDLEGQRVKALPLLGHLPSLEELYIEGLNSICTVGSEFHGSNNPFPSLLTLEFKGMLIWEDWSHCIDTEEVGVVFPRLDHLVIQDCPKLKALPSFISLPSLNELEFQGCNEGVLQSLVSSASLTALTINDVVELTCLNHGLTSSLIKLEKLEIRGCTKLRYLWQEGDAIQTLRCLKSLVVHSCPKFIYFVAEEGDIELPSNLETIELMKCVNLEKLPSTMHTLSSLRDLTVYGCPKLVSFPETGIPTSMISLDIMDCKMLRSLPRGFLPTTLKRLDICDCGGLESLTEINLDPLQSLQEIQIVCCENLRSLPQGLHTLSQLTSLVLSGCPALEVECFPPLPPSILEFFLYSCPKIKSLPNQLYRLTCLRKLSIWRCERFTRFPDGGLPPQLWELEVTQCENMKQPVREWLTPLTSLGRLNIDGSAGGVGEEEDLVLPLPSSLLHLSIHDMGKVERLSSSLPPSLQNLWIQCCLKLRELPQDSLPPSLEELLLYNCPILEKRCKKGTGCYWPLICEIPQITLGVYIG